MTVIINCQTTPHHIDLFRMCDQTCVFIVQDKTIHFELSTSQDCSNNNICNQLPFLILFCSLIASAPGWLHSIHHHPFGFLNTRICNWT